MLLPKNDAFYGLSGTDVVTSYFIPSKSKKASGVRTHRPRLHISTLLLFLLLLAATIKVVQSSEEGGEHHNATEQVDGGHTSEEEGEHTEHIEPAHAVLFPSFTLTIGVLVFYLLSRYLHALPYTAIMFLIGTLMGIGAGLLQNTDQLTESIQLWVRIDSEVLLLVFLPGLIFKDAMGQNVHLFRIALLQCINFAVPMVLAGTTLTALIARYVFPYGWSMNLAMTFGSILSATDPVAVAILLEEVGAPPRLKVHIAGESLLNDGAAIVFFSIFGARYLYELGIPGLGEDIDVARGFAIFFRKSLGGVAVGLFFGLGLLLILYYLDRRFNREENVVEVTATAAIAYVGYYVAEAVWETSGVISNVTTGLTVKYFGRAMMNDPKLLEDFWTLVEHLLNTILFTLGGIVWGATIAVGEKERQFTGKDWGYLILLYVLLLVIRAFLFVSAYPITSHIGLKTCWPETIFQVWGGLRGAVGIALALALDNEVIEATNESSDPLDEQVYRGQTKILFAMVGGIAFMTLLINGTTAGPLLRKLGLADSTVTREKIVNAYRISFRASLIDNLVRLLTQHRFRHVSFALVKYHVPIIADLTKTQLLQAVEHHKETTPPDEYKAPHLERILPYLKEDEEARMVFYSGTVPTIETDTLSSLDTVAQARKLQHERRKRMRRRRRSKSNMQYMMGGEPLSAQELRLLFISILRAAYDQQIYDGELEEREFLAISLEQSLEFAADAVSNGKPLQDWEYVTLIDSPVSLVVSKFKKSPAAMRCLEKCLGESVNVDVKHTVHRLKIERSLAFMAAHRWAQEYFTQQFETAESELSEAGKIVLSESQAQYVKAEEVLAKYDPQTVEIVASHKFCSILLNTGITFVGKLVKNGLLKDEEAEHFVEEIEENLRKLLACTEEEHPGELDVEDESDAES